jgi:hypothetical protein
VNVLGWPSLSLDDALAQARSLADVPLAQARLIARTSHASALPSATAIAVDDNRVRELQARLRQVADEVGWPQGLRADIADRVERDWGRVLVDEMSMSPAGAADAGVWRFVGLVVVPDLTLWRSRVADPRAMVRASGELFGRLWSWHWTLGSDLIDDSSRGPLAGAEMSALFRRRDVVANRRVARAVARRVLDVPAARDRVSLVKYLTLEVLRVSPAVSLESLSDGELDALVASL